ncbi:penicillinase repressor [Hymenobacter qilianensis]|jgi:predicted transcriptional regulator|uniref:Penicillinase repressor n=2 Tax=Hymenobacter qilianensis TaxID=1385715 RepID=A0ACB5PLF4_9BACT|nr:MULTISPECIES: BlaI/MecI/CopY family transcriptional regulator [Hymenobacter]MBC6606556.1 BlaI/MecI/CopY family transcriptional regulator [Hymenobacter sp. BT188]QNP50842.1 BlaI/MecI/CopY family transcriptional regulator [Hymenobacter qilianensis]GGF50272.1 penicillinase repressor [Hymenobacter qilianensis]
MSKPPLPKPTESELEILQVLWQHGPTTVRFVNDELNKKRDVGYTTTLKLLQLMLDKGLVLRDDDSRTHVYRAALREEETQGLLIDRLLDAAFGGSALKLVVQALGHQRTSQAELDQIRDLLNEMEEQKNTTEKGGTNELA